MLIKETQLEGLYIINVPVYKDERGCLFESYTKRKYDAVPGIKIHEFNHEIISISNENVFRGFHFQKEPYEQGKLCQVLHGWATDIVVDIRPDSKTYKQVEKIKLGSDIVDGFKKQLWIPSGFAHGFLSHTNNTIFHYKCTQLRIPSAERTINVKEFSFELGFRLDELIMSERDKNGITLKEYEREQNEKV